MVVIYAVERAGLIDLGGHKISKQLQLLPPWLIILFGAFIIPFIEELIFRLYLRLKQNYPARLFILITSITGKKNKENIKTYIESKWQAYYKGIFYLSALIFALVHIVNFKYSITLLIFVPILVAPQLILGLFTGYLRVKYGLIWGFYLHALHNLIFLAIPLVFMSGPLEKLNISNDKYKLKIEEIGFGKLDSKFSSFTKDSVFFENIKLKTLISKLLDKKEKLIEFNPDEKSNQKINLTFKTYSDPLKSKQIILNELQNAYGFTITKDNILRENWKLQISDTTLLMQHKSDSSNSSTTTVSSKEIKLENADFNQLVHTLNSSYDKYILTEIDLPNKFNFKLQKNEFDKLMDLLGREYGLLLKMSRIEIEHVKIDFKEKKTNGT